MATQGSQKCWTCLLLKVDKYELFLRLFVEYGDLCIHFSVFQAGWYDIMEDCGLKTRKMMTGNSADEPDNSHW